MCKQLCRRAQNEIHFWQMHASNQLKASDGFVRWGKNRNIWQLCSHNIEHPRPPRSFDESEKMRNSRNLLENRKKKKNGIRSNFVLNFSTVFFFSTATAEQSLWNSFDKIEWGSMSNRLHSPFMNIHRYFGSILYSDVRDLWCVWWIQHFCETRITFFSNILELVHMRTLEFLNRVYDPHSPNEY